jgi:hypothetical protein
MKAIKQLASFIVTIKFGVKPLVGRRMILQERAFTTPIWYTP